ncbi:MAG TPA: hypothetical protein ENJ80_06800 [Gammaproteobacteria bacterium]|nr:hypothetical protein [Gammaproteobacteria bacterium]
MTVVYRSILTGLIAVIITLAGCGGGGGGTTLSGIGGTGKTISGTITQFGSIFVNGVEYDIDNASFTVNDVSSPGLSQADLRIGMVVTLTGNDDGTVGVASEVIYDNEITGPVSNLVASPGGTTLSFTVFDVNVVADVANTTFDNDNAPGFSFATLADGDIIEVSGLFDNSSTLVASYIEKTDDLNLGSSEVEIKGTPVTGTDAGVGQSFIMNGITINILAGTDLSDLPGGRVTDAQFIEVKGTLVTASPAEINATSIELEGEGIGSDEGEASIEGFVTEFNDNSDFKVSGQPVDATGATFEPAGLVLRNDLHVEVEGLLVNGILIADEVKEEN